MGEALELATQHKPHVAVVAVSLPLLKGLEVNRGIRRGSPLTQVLALSSQEREDLISMALAAGAQSWLIKTAVTSLLESVARDRKKRAARGAPRGAASRERCSLLMDGADRRSTSPLFPRATRRRARPSA
jgi:DNA-binding NarL/FixJ family response regulator